MVFMLRKLYIYFTKDPEAVHFFPGGGGGGGEVSGPPCPPLDPHVGNVIITGQYLSQSGLKP